MGATTGIQWTDHTFNPWWGCTKVSAGCTNCYAEAWAKRTGFKVWGVDGERRTFGEKHWREPEHWNVAAEKRGVRARVFCASMADVFEDRPDLDDERVRLFDLIRRTPWLDWQILTKRPENILTTLRRVVDDTNIINVMNMVSLWLDGKPPPNVWLGTSVESPGVLVDRVTALLRVPAAQSFLSCEPLLGPVSLSSWLDFVHEDEIGGRGAHPVRTIDANGVVGADPWLRGITWVIVGGESGANARACDVNWIRYVVDDCKLHGVPCFVKQLGSNPVNMVAAQPVMLAHAKGGDPEEWPERLRVREVPT